MMSNQIFLRKVGWIFKFSPVEVGAKVAVAVKVKDQGEVQAVPAQGQIFSHGQFTAIAVGGHEGGCNALNRLDRTLRAHARVCACAIFSSPLCSATAGMD